MVHKLSHYNRLVTMAASSLKRKRLRNEVDDDADESLPISKKINGLHIQTDRNYLHQEDQLSPQILGEELKNEKGSLTAIRCDLRKEEDILNMFKSIKDDSNLGGVDVCINNAGLGHDAPLLSGLTEKWKDMLEVNVIAPAICSREAYQSMKERGVDDGHIIYINSMSGHRIGSKSFSHFICATKFGLTAMVEAARQELRELKSHIRVTAISPGNVVTPFAGKLFKDKSKGDALYSQIRCMDAKDIADTVVFALQVPQHVEINDVLMRPTEGVH